MTAQLFDSAVGSCDLSACDRAQQYCSNVANEMLGDGSYLVPSVCSGLTWASYPN